jgi:hypothetical protein
MARTKTGSAKPTGRPSLATPELFDAICDRIADGISLRTICDADDMPHRATVLRWLDDKQHEAFATKYARAREAQGDVMDEKILSVADACTPETAAADRVKIDAYKWRASKLAPKKYGDKLAVVGGDPERGDNPIQISNRDRAKAVAALVAKAKSTKAGA